MKDFSKRSILPTVQAKKSACRELFRNQKTEGIEVEALGHNSITLR